MKRPPTKGFTGRTHTEETKAKIAAASRGNKHNLGRIQTVETKEKRSIALMRNRNAIGYSHTEEAKVKIALAKRGHIPPFKCGRGKTGYREDIGHFVRSTWEANFARILNFLNVKYEYEYRQFDLGELGVYLPDFYIPELLLFIEIKGYETYLSQKKPLALMRKGIPCIVLGKERYSVLEEKYRKDISFWER